MANNFYVLQAVDVRRATEAGSSRAITISKLTLPAVKFITADHTPGGSVMTVDFTLPRIEALEPAFEAKGIDLEIFAGMGEVDRWTFAGAYREKRTGKVIPCRAIIEGAVVEWEPDDSDPTELQGCNYAFKEVTHYEFIMDGKELFYVDDWERVLRLNGQDRFAEIRNALGA